MRFDATMSPVVYVTVVINPMLCVKEYNECALLINDILDDETHLLERFINELPAPPLGQGFVFNACRS